MPKRSRPKLRTTLPDATPRVAPRAAPKRLLDLPRNVTRTSKERTLLALQSEDERARILKNFDDAVYSRGSSSVRDVQYRTWHEWHRAWFNNDEVLPLTPEKIRAVASCFKDANYRSYDNYASCLRHEHIAAGYPWSELLDLCTADAHRSVYRGMGPPRSAMPLNLMQVAALPLVMASYLHLALIPEADVLNPAAIFIFASMFLLREIEAAALKWKHICLNTAARSVRVFLAISKTDVEARGCFRSWGCTCIHGQTVPCAYHSLLAHRDSLASLGYSVEGDAPVCTTAAGEHPTKERMVAAFIYLASVIGAVGNTAAQIVTGHSCRVSGAQFLASLGLELSLIQLLARWESAVIMRYVKESPLLALTGTTRSKISDLLGVIDTTKIRATTSSALSSTQAVAVVSPGAMAPADHSDTATLTLSLVKDFIAKWSRRLKTMRREHATALHLLDLERHEDLYDDHVKGVAIDEYVVVTNLINEMAHVYRPSSGVPISNPEARSRCGWPFHLGSVRSSDFASPDAHALRRKRCWRGIASVATSGSEADVR